ncbi:interferon-induced protein with tetratricopeptide repeats 8 [Neoarius graeffei]|uniref:interferon-induced protein with tetratricopeptide repeats 8 n=1 Tax=Neoarius graeffei TaxID=443677 RepID=UPI00298CBE83|nr:interferon-induced protein with tetratricopeptide repeats 8 [Neoarius graeffei]
MFEEELKKLECHFTWDLQKEDADLNYLMIKFSESLSVQTDHGGNFRQRNLNFCAYIYHLQGFSDQARDCLEKAKEAQNGHSSNIVTYGNLAWLHHHVADNTMTKVYLEKLAQISGAFPTPAEEMQREVLSEKAWSFLHFSKKHYIKAKEIFHESIQKEPEDKEWNTGYAFALFHLEGLEIREDKRLPFEESPAVNQLKRALKLDPDNAMIHIFMGLKCYKNNRNAEAWGHMKQALDMAPYDLSVVLRVAKFMKKEQCYDMALGVLNKMLEKAPDSSRLHHEIAKNYRWKAMQLGDTHNPKLLSLCIHHSEEGARLNPDFIYPQIELALRYAEVGNYAKAKQKFQELIARPDLQPADLQAWHRIYGDFNMYRLGSEATAVKHYKEGLALRKVSTEWRICKNRLHKVLRNTRNDVYQIREFMNSLRESAERIEN